VAEGSGERRGPATRRVPARLLASVAAALALVFVASTAATPRSEFRPLPSVDKIRKLKTKKAATRKKTPPTRPCVGDCAVPSKYKTYEGFVLWSGDDARAFWQSAFGRAELRFTPARHVILSDGRSHRTRCSVKPGVVRTDHPGGPFYCPADGPGTVLIPADTTKRIVFERAPHYRLRDYRERDFAFSVIVAHEWAHHVQKLLGLLEGPSIRVELQADCLAGLWARSAWARSLLEPGDLEEAVRVASASGDRPGIRPGDRGAHGTSAQRVEWFRRGYTTGDGGRCDTSAVPVR
jgi:predicted metalloprotease